MIGRNASFIPKRDEEAFRRNVTPKPCPLLVDWTRSVPARQCYSELAALRNRRSGQTNDELRGIINEPFAAHYFGFHDPVRRSSIGVRAIAAVKWGSTFHPGEADYSNRTMRLAPFLQVLLVIFLGSPKLRCRLNDSDDWSGKTPAVLEPLLCRLRGSLLFRRMIENG